MEIFFSARHIIRKLSAEADRVGFGDAAVGAKRFTEGGVFISGGHGSVGGADEGAEVAVAVE